MKKTLMFLGALALMGGMAFNFAVAKQASSEDVKLSELAGMKEASAECPGYAKASIGDIVYTVLCNCIIVRSNGGSEPC